MSCDECDKNIREENPEHQAIVVTLFDKAENCFTIETREARQWCTVLSPEDLQIQLSERGRIALLIVRDGGQLGVLTREYHLGTIGCISLACLVRRSSVFAPRKAYHVRPCRLEIVYVVRDGWSKRPNMQSNARRAIFRSTWLSEDEDSKRRS